MKDLHRRKMYKIIGKVYRWDCPCCNHTLIGNKRKNRRTINKQIRQRLKNDLRNYEE